MGKRELKYAVLHGIVKVPDAAQIGPTVHSSTNGSNPGYKMTLDDELNELRVEAVNPLTKEVVVIYLPKTSLSHFQVKD